MTLVRASLYTGWIALSALGAGAQEENTVREYGLAGDLGGRRSLWRDQGFAPFLNYTSDSLAALDGGFKEGESFQGALEFGADFDFGLIANWPGVSLHLHGIYLHGDDPSADLVGDFNYLSNIVAEGGVRLYQVALSLTRGNFDWRFGVIAPDDDFAISASSEIFVNSAFGVMPSLSCNSGLAIWPRSGLGIRGAVTLPQEWTLVAGLYDGNVPDDRPNRFGTRFHLDNTEGLIGLVEIGKGWKLDTKAGAVKLGAWHHSGEFTEHESGELIRRNHGFHVIVEQALGRNDQINIFARAGFSPRDNRSVVRWHKDVGATITGLFPGRSNDVLGIAAFQTTFSPTYLASRRDAGEGVTSSESGIEVTYSIALRPGLSLQPDFQYIFDPHESRRDAAVAILRLYAEF